MNYLYYIMSIQITIGNVYFENVESVTIRKSIKKLTDTAKIVIPRNLSKIEKDGEKSSLKHQNIRNYIKVGDKVIIKIGYDNRTIEEFKGYVSKIGADIPLEIACEDEMWQLKQTNFNKSYKKVKLKALLQDIAPGYKYDIIDNINLGKFQIKNASAYEVLKLLRKNYGLHSYFEGKTLHVGFPISLKPTQMHQIHLNRNVRAQRKDLKFVSKDDVKLLIKAISINADGTRIETTYGDNNGTVRTLHFTGKALDELRELAEKNYKSLSFDGYQGKIPTWHIPVINPGDAVEITDPMYDNSERNGKYLVEEVTLKFDKNSGIKRESKIGMKI